MAGTGEFMDVRQDLTANAKITTFVAEIGSCGPGGQSVLGSYQSRQVAVGRRAFGSTTSGAPVRRPRGLVAHGSRTYHAPEKLIN